MKLDGVHHVTAITGDAPRNLDFYARVLGLRLVKKSVNQDDPTVYHLFYGDEEGAPGNDITFFEYPGARQGKAGAGMVHTVGWRVATPEAIDFWEGRLADEGIAGERYDGRRLRVPRPRGPAARADPRREPGRAADRRPSGGAEGVRAAGLPRRPRLRARPGAEPPLPRGDARVRAARRDGLGGARRAPRRPLPLRPERRARRPRRGHGSPRRLGLADGRARGLAATASPRAAPTPRR